MNRGRIGVISLVLVLALGGLGVGYAQWTENLSIAGTVTTAELNWEFTYAGTNDPGTSNDENANPGFLNIAPIGQHIGSTTATLVNDDGDAGFNKVELTLSTVYPGYYGRVGLNARNNGSLDLKILATILTSPNLTNITLVNPGHWMSDELELRFLDNVGTILTVGQTKGLAFEVLVLDGADQGATYQFTLTIIGEQYTP